MEKQASSRPMSKRMFGNDITNRLTREKTRMISQKTPQKVANEVQSQPTDTKLFEASEESHDPLNDHYYDITSYILSAQKKYKQEITVNIKPKMRKTLIDWLITFHSKSNLREQTLYLALAYLNQYSAMVDIYQQEYQLVGIACLWIATKFEEIERPSVLKYLLSGSFSISELNQVEGKILLALNFNLNIVTPLNILEIITDDWPKLTNGRLGSQSQKILAMAKYIIELSLFQGLAKDYCMTTIVINALKLSNSVMGVSHHTLAREIMEDEAMVECFMEMRVILKNNSNPKLRFNSLKKKFLYQRYWGVAKIHIN